MRPVTLRPATTADQPELERLAGLDSRSLPPGPHLVAERDGRVEAAMSVCTQELVADPFRRTAELCALLRCYGCAGPPSAKRRRSGLLEPRVRLVPA